MLLKSQPTWFDRTGHPVGTIGDPALYFGLMPSPDGKYAATEFFDPTALTINIWIFDFAAGNASRLTFVNYAAGNPIWSPDSQRVLFTQYRDYFDVVSLLGGAQERIPFPGGTNADFPMGWSSDGQNLLLTRSMQATLDLWILPISGDHKSRPYLNQPVNESDGRISPDGHWVAYTSDESGRNEVFIQSFPVPGNKKRVSVAGGFNPMWRKDGRELYFLTEDHALMAVSAKTSNGALELSPPSRLFSEKSLGADIYGSSSGQRAWFAPSPDGQRFLLLVPIDSDHPDTLHLIHNWKP
jgi:Tol biopolymer transport system component